MLRSLNEKISSRSIQINEDLLTALKKMDQLQVKSLLVFQDDKFMNILSIGDIQRAILRNLSLDTSVTLVLRDHSTLASSDSSLESIMETMLQRRIECMPVLDEDRNLVDVIFWEDVFETPKGVKEKFDLPVVIMAGGKGTRLKPITNVLPKALIPIGEKSILEHIMDRFAEAGSHKFHLSVNYKAAIIKYYFDQLEGAEYKIEYFQEPKPLGTVGSLYLLKDSINSTFFVTNCDILIDADYSEILHYHRQQKNEITIVSALKHYEIPYGTLETGNQGQLVKLSEKPELTFQINSGMYILEPHLLEEIPKEEFYHITHLIEKVVDRNGRVGVFPVSQGSWIDIGQWDEYLSLKHHQEK
jgi:dTDP-glucose pyrophosphorylase/CBS domain-containing protein